MNIFSNLFRKSQKPNNETNAVSPPKENQPPAKHYVDMLFDLKNDVKILKSQEDFTDFLSNFPDDKIAIFINYDLSKLITEKHSIALDEYVESVRKNQNKALFYRGLRHGPCICCAFTKSCMPDDFGYVLFTKCKVSALYL